MMRAFRTGFKFLAVIAIIVSTIYFGIMELVTLIAKASPVWQFIGTGAMIAAVIIILSTYVGYILDDTEED